MWLVSSRSVGLATDLRDWYGSAKPCWCARLLGNQDSWLRKTMNQQAWLKVTVTNGPKSLLHSQHSQVLLLSPVMKLVRFPPEDHINSNLSSSKTMAWVFWLSDTCRYESLAQEQETGFLLLRKMCIYRKSSSHLGILLGPWFVGVSFFKYRITILFRNIWVSKCFPNDCEKWELLRTVWQHRSVPWDLWSLVLQ